MHDGARWLKSHLSHCGQKISSSGSSGSSENTHSSSFLRETKEKTRTQLLPVPDQSVQEKTTILQSETMLLPLSCPATAFDGTFCKIRSSREHDSCALDGFEVQPLDHGRFQQSDVGQQIQNVEKARQVQGTTVKIPIGVNIPQGQSRHTPANHGRRKGILMGALKAFCKS